MAQISPLVAYNPSQIFYFFILDLDWYKRVVKTMLSASTIVANGNSGTTCVDNIATSTDSALQLVVNCDVI